MSAVTNWYKAKLGPINPGDKVEFTVKDLLEFQRSRKSNFIGRFFTEIKLGWGKGPVNEKTVQRLIQNLSKEKLLELMGLAVAAKSELIKLKYKPKGAPADADSNKHSTLFSHDSVGKEVRPEYNLKMMIDSNTKTFNDWQDEVEKFKEMVNKPALAKEKEAREQALVRELATEMNELDYLATFGRAIFAIEPPIKYIDNYSGTASDILMYNLADKYQRVLNKLRKGEYLNNDLEKIENEIKKAKAAKQPQVQVDLKEKPTIDTTTPANTTETDLLSESDTEDEQGHVDDNNSREPADPLGEQDTHTSSGSESQDETDLNDEDSSLGSPKSTKELDPDDDINNPSKDDKYSDISDTEHDIGMPRNWGTEDLSPDSDRIANEIKAEADAMAKNLENLTLKEVQNQYPLFTDFCNNSGQKIEADELTLSNKSTSWAYYPTLAKVSSSSSEQAGMAKQLIFPWLDKVNGKYTLKSRFGDLIKEPKLLKQLFSEYMVLKQKGYMQ